MKCIYCNTECDLTSSDIITYALTGAKLTKAFVCKKHNAFTNDNYEKQFVSDLDFFRNHLRLTTRDGNVIRYKADISVDGTEIQNVKLSNRDSFFVPRDVIAGTEPSGKKVLIAPIEKLEKISNGKAIPIDISNVIVHKSVNSDSFIGFCAVHSIAKMAYEWYCYINNIEEYKEECRGIVNYILGNTEDGFVDIIIDGNYYGAIDMLSEIGTHSFFQYDDLDGNRYVVFDFWKTISYRIRICKSPEKKLPDEQASYFKLFLYHIDGRKTQSVFGIVSLDGNKKPHLMTIRPQNITIDLWRVFVERIDKIITTMVLSINSLKREVDKLSAKLKKYDLGDIDVAILLGFEDNDVLTTIEVINQLYVNRDKYDTQKSFNQNG